MRFSPVVVSRQNVHDLLLMSERIQSIFQLALVSVQSSSAKELPETAIKAWKRRFMMDLRTSKPLLIYFLNICICDHLT